MSRCVVCDRPVVVEPLLLSDGRLIHAACEERLYDVTQRPGGAHPKSGSRIRAARAKKQTG
jgi:hypothetical protein